MELGKKIYELRRESGVTQEELAAELGVTAAAVSKWEKGNTLPDVLMVCAIADWFGISVDALLGRSRELKRLILVTEGEERKKIESLLRSHGFCAAGYADDLAQAGNLCREQNARGVLRIGHEPLTGQQRETVGKCDMGDCAYDTPEDLWGNLDTILAMMEKHF